jgi:hypothetical protein
VPRKPTVWFREQDGWYYTTLRGVQTKLSKGPREAERAFHALLSQEPDEERKAYRPSFRKLADLYLTFTRQTKAERTYAHQQYFLQSFCDHVKAKRVADLSRSGVTRSDSRGWGRGAGISALLASFEALGWAGQAAAATAVPGPGAP